MKEGTKLKKSLFIRLFNLLTDTLSQLLNRENTTIFKRSATDKKITLSSFTYSKSLSINPCVSNTNQKLLIKRRIRRLSLHNRLFKKQQNHLINKKYNNPKLASFININSPNRNELSTSALFLNSFRFISVLGRGQYGKVFLGKFKPTEKLYAIKTIKKEQLLSENSTNTILIEKKILQIINKNKNPFLVQMFACFQTQQHVFFVIEYASGGDLITSVLKDKFYSKKRTCFYAACIVLGLKFLHQHNILYRDLKLDNLLLDSRGYVKLTDFGICKLNFKYMDSTHTFCGTDDYMAPEIVLHHGYNRAVDWWALGIVIYEMLVGKLPFSNKFQRLNQPVYYPRFLSKDSKSLVDNLLCKIPKNRLGSSEFGADEVISHSFFKSIDCDKLYFKRIKAPHIPTIKSLKDVSNFGDQFTCEDPCLTPSNDFNNNYECNNSLVFEDFDFVSDCF